MRYVIRLSGTDRYLENSERSPYQWVARDYGQRFTSSEADRIVASNPHASYEVEKAE